MTPILIPAHFSGSPIGTRYAYTDATALAPGRYWYRLDVVRLDGSHEPVGLVDVRVTRVSKGSYTVTAIVNHWLSSQRRKPISNHCSRLSLEDTNHWTWRIGLCVNS